MAFEFTCVGDGCEYVQQYSQCQFWIGAPNACWEGFGMCACCTRSYRVANTGPDPNCPDDDPEPWTHLNLWDPESYFDGRLLLPNCRMGFALVGDRPAVLKKPVERG